MHITNGIYTIFIYSGSNMSNQMYIAEQQELGITVGRHVTETIHKCTLKAIV
jgi:hypothetical protein